MLSRRLEIAPRSARAELIFSMAPSITWSAFEAPVAVETSAVPTFVRLELVMMVPEVPAAPKNSPSATTVSKASLAGVPLSKSVPS